MECFGACALGRSFVSAALLFHIVLGRISMIPTKPAHVTFPGLMGNFIRISSMRKELGQPGGKPAAAKNNTETR